MIYYKDNFLLILQKNFYLLEILSVLQKNFYFSYTYIFWSLELYFPYIDVILSWYVMWTLIIDLFKYIYICTYYLFILFYL